MPFAKFGELFWGNIIADRLVLQVCAPIDMHRSLDVAGVVEKVVLVALHEADAGVRQMLGDPLRRDQGIRLGVIFINHEMPLTSKRLLRASGNGPQSGVRPFKSRDAGFEVRDGFRRNA